MHCKSASDLPAFPEFDFRMSGEVRNKPQVPIIHLIHHFVVPLPLKGKVGVLVFLYAETNNTKTKTNICREQALVKWDMVYNLSMDMVYNFCLGSP